VKILINVTTDIINPGRDFNGEIEINGEKFLYLLSFKRSLDGNPPKNKPKTLEEFKKEVSFELKRKEKEGEIKIKLTDKEELFFLSLAITSAIKAHFNIKRELRELLGIEDVSKMTLSGINLIEAEVSVELQDQLGDPKFGNIFPTLTQ